MFLRNFLCFGFVLQLWLPPLCVAQTLEPSQEVSLDRQGHEVLWALDTPLEALLNQRAGVSLGRRLTSWLSAWGELRVSWEQAPSIVRFGASVWPAGDPLRGLYVAAGPSLIMAPHAPVGVDPFVGLGVRYGWEGVAVTLSARWDLGQPRVVPALGLMFGLTFGGTT